jgi:hypothetical protein
MALLNFPYWHTISPAMRSVLDQIGQRPFSNRFYLAGGTGLALQIGHRRSDDLHFFSVSDELDDQSRIEIINYLHPHSIKVIENVSGNLLLLVDGIQTVAVMV